jgi:hypothetical protein
MKKILIVLFVIGQVTIIKAQKDTLINSIGYISTLMNSGSGQKLSADSYKGYPNDLTQSKIFFIEVSKEETQSNTGLMGPNYKKINSKLTETMNKKYPHAFEVFTSDYKSKGNDFFITKGFKYRLLIQSKWYGVHKTRTSTSGDYMGSSTQWKQRFRIIIEDINSGNKYTIKTLTMPFKKAIKYFLETQFK